MNFIFGLIEALCAILELILLVLSGKKKKEKTKQRIRTKDVCQNIQYGSINASYAEQSIGGTSNEECLKLANMARKEINDELANGTIKELY